MPDNGQVTVTNIEKNERYELNGVCKTVANAISKFFNGGAFTGEVRVNGDKVTNMQTTLRPGDVILLLTAAVAGGGVKGARS
jgi:hypothetical protein